MHFASGSTGLYVPVARATSMEEPGLLADGRGVLRPKIASASRPSNVAVDWTMPVVFALVSKTKANSLRFSS
jgi:hypothetical protein